jgi:outer membrane protein
MKFYLIIAGFLFLQFSYAQEDTNTSVPKIWSLEECITYAIENNITVKDALLNTNIAEVNYDKAKSSRLPNLFSSASQSFSNGNSIDPITSDFVSDQIYSTNMGINSSMTLFQGNQISNDIKQRKLLLEQSLYIEEITRNDIEVSILEIYLQSLFSKENIGIAENNFAVSENEVLRAKARLDAGEIALNDYTEAQSQTATNKYQVIEAKNNYQQNIITLKQLLELSPMQDIEIETIDKDLDLINLDLDKIAIYNEALGYLPEIKASELNIAINQKELSIAKGAYLPTLSLNGSVGTGYTSIKDNTFTEQFNLNFNQRVGLSLNVPIFNRNQSGSKHSNYKH